MGELVGRLLGCWVDGESELWRGGDGGWLDQWVTWLADYWVVGWMESLSCGGVEVGGLING